MTSELKTCGTCGHAMIASESATCTRRPGAVKSVRSVGAYACEAYTSDSVERVALDAVAAIRDMGEAMWDTSPHTVSLVADEAHRALKARLRELGVGE